MMFPFDYYAQYNDDTDEAVPCNPIKPTSDDLDPGHRESEADEMITILSEKIGALMEKEKKLHSLICAFHDGILYMSNSTNDQLRSPYHLRQSASNVWKVLMDKMTLDEYKEYIRTQGRAAMGP